MRLGWARFAQPRVTAFRGRRYFVLDPNVFSEVVSKALADHLGYAIFAGSVHSPCRGVDPVGRVALQVDADVGVGPDWTSGPS